MLASSEFFGPLRLEAAGLAGLGAGYTFVTAIELAGLVIGLVVVLAIALAVVLVVVLVIVLAAELAAELAKLYFFLVLIDIFFSVPFDIGLTS